jgi:hypothetical protein
VPDLGRVSGRVVTLDGVPVSGARISAAGREARSDAAGRFTLERMAPADRLAVAVASDSFVGTVAAYRVEPGSESYRTIPLIARAAAVRLDAGRGGEVSLGRDGRLVVPGGALVDASGRAATGEVLVRATYIDPSDPRQVAAAPGDYRTEPRSDPTSQLETYGMVEVSFASPGGRELRLAEGRTAQLEWPAPRRAADARANLYRLNGATGLWEVGSQRFERVAFIRDSPIWNWDYLYTCTCIDVDIGTPLAGISVTGHGVDYSGTSIAYTNAQGRAFLAVRPSSVVDVTFTAPGTSTSTVRVNTPAAGVVLPPCRPQTRPVELTFNQALLTERRVDAITPIRIR